MKLNDFRELNMNNYTEDDVAKLSEWAIWAYDKIKALEEKYKQRKRHCLSLMYGRCKEQDGD